MNISCSNPTDSGTILIVEDEDLLRHYLSMILQKRGYKILDASDAFEAQAIIESEEVAVVLCDEGLPRKKGMTWLEELKHSRPNILRLLMSGHIKDGSVEPALESGLIHGYLEKPFDLTSFDSALSKAISERTIAVA